MQFYIYVYLQKKLIEQNEDIKRNGICFVYNWNLSSLRLLINFPDREICIRKDDSIQMDRRLAMELAGNSDFVITIETL